MSLCPPLSSLSFTGEDIQQIFSAVLAVLLLGELEFSDAAFPGRQGAGAGAGRKGGGGGSGDGGCRIVGAIDFGSDEDNEDNEEEDNEEEEEEEEEHVKTIGGDDGSSSDGTKTEEEEAHRDGVVVGALETLAALLGKDPCILHAALCTRSIRAGARASSVTAQLTAQQASDSRDAIAKVR